MFELLRDLSNWTVDFADSGWGILVLAIGSFAESIFFPVPPDPLLIGISIRHPESALWLAAMVTAFSVAGALVGHWLGRRFGRPLLRRLIPHSKIERAELLFTKYGIWAVAIAAFTPLPYKAFTISAGILDMDRRSLIVASILGRGARFFLLGGLIFAYGESIEQFAADNFELLALGVLGAVIAGISIIILIIRIRQGRNSV